MEGRPAKNIVTECSGSSKTVVSGGVSEHRDGASQTPCYLPSLPVSVSSNGATLAFEEQNTQADEIYSTIRPHYNSQALLENAESYQPFITHVEEGPEATNNCIADPSKNARCTMATSGPQWRPKYLRRRILAAFSAVFLVMIATLELLDALSRRNDGIANGFNKDHYLWTYGPTAFLNLIAALFNRVEYQAKLMAPWERLSKHPAPARQTLLLDYVSALQPVTFYQSLRNKDYAVAATTTVSALMKLLIVLSSGLITLSRVGVHHATIPMEVQSAFFDDDSTVQAKSTFPAFILKEIVEGNSYPPGISKHFAFQTVQSQLPETAQYQVTVDGLRTFLQCENAMAKMTGTEPVSEELAKLTITSPSCEVFFTGVGGLDPWSEVAMPYQRDVWTFEPVQCNDTTDDSGKRVLISFWIIEWFVNGTTPTEKVDPGCPGSRYTCENTSNVYTRMLKSSQLLCTTGYDITKIDVVQNGTTVQSVLPVHPRPQESFNRTLDHVSPWSITEAYFHAFEEGFFSIESYNNLSAAFNLSHDVTMNTHMTYLLKSQLPAGIDSSLLYNPEFIQNLAKEYYQQVGAIIAQQFILKPVSVHTTGSAVIMEDRLIVREWAVQMMVGIIATCVILSIFTAFIIPQYAILHRSPSTLSGIAALVAQSSELLEQLRYSGDAVSKTLHLQLEESKFHSEVIHNSLPGLGHPKQSFVIKNVVPASACIRPYRFHQSESTHSHPWILHPASRIALGVLLITLVVTLEVTLHQSHTYDGLGDVGDIAYIHYTWTSIPALIFGGLTIIISSVDFSVRSFAPYSSLNDVVTAHTFTNLDFLDMSVPTAIIKEAKLRNIGASATTITLLVASFFTIFSGSLFQGVFFSSVSLVQLRANNSFGLTSPEVPIDMDFDAGLILLGNLSYPSFTYEDLAFPQLLPTTALTANDFSNTSLLSVKAVVPALRSYLECHLFDKDMIRAQIQPKHYDLDRAFSRENSVLTFTVNDEEIKYLNGTASYETDLRIYSNTSYFGVDFPLRLNSSEGGKYIFTWGKIDHFADSKVGHIAVMGCNTSTEAVDVETNFIGPDLAIDIEDSPRPVPNTERRPTISLTSILRYIHQSSLNQPDIPTDEMLTSTFALLTQSRWAVPLSTLGGGSDEVVADAIKFQHGILATQALNQFRVPATETNSTLTPEQALEGENDAGRTFEATVVDKAGRQRVVQDAISTRVLEALLLVTLVLLGVGWVWLPKTNVLPKRSPTTIASAVALLAGGNLEEWVHEVDSDATTEHGGPGKMKKFWMGWGNVPDEEGILMGNENENGVSRFGIFAVPVDRSDEK